MSIVIKETPEEVIDFLPDVIAATNSAKEELGFLPEKAYENAAASRKLYIAVNINRNHKTYAGHLMFGGLFPQAKIFQLFVLEKFRSHGIARNLLDYLKNQLISSQWLSIVANVAGDLEANSVWERMGFRIIRTKSGGNARKRTINVRVQELESTSLLSMMTSPSSDYGLRFPERLAHRPIYLFDLNVLFDVVKKRPRVDAANKIVWAGMTNSIRLMVAAEFILELQRTSTIPDNDPVLAFALQADRLDPPPGKDLNALIEKLAPIVFTERQQQGKLTKQDLSDLKHIATAIHHSAAGFITSEKAILRARITLHETWGLDVIGVEEFAELVETKDSCNIDATAELSSGVLHVYKNRSCDLNEAEKLLRSVNASQTFIQEALDCKGTQKKWIILKNNTKTVGYAKWNIYGATKRTSDIYLSVDETNNAIEAVLDYLLDKVPYDISETSPTLIRLFIPFGQTKIRQAAFAMGFRPPRGADNDHWLLQRLALGRIVLPENWKKVRQALQSVASLSLPELMPSYDDARKTIPLKTSDATNNVSLNEIEGLLSPVLFLFLGRSGVIVPIRETFARDLLGASPQMSMLSPPEAVLRHERVYISSDKTAERMKPGTPIIFYESMRGNGCGCAIAIARISESRIISKTAILDKVLHKGVLDQKSLDTLWASHKVTETSFDNIFIFKHPVSFQRLREIGCVDRSNLVSARTISYEKMARIVKEGQANGQS